MMAIRKLLLRDKCLKVLRSMADDRGGLMTAEEISSAIGGGHSVQSIHRAMRELKILRRDITHRKRLGYRLRVRYEEEPVANCRASDGMGTVSRSLEASMSVSCEPRRLLGGW